MLIRKLIPNFRRKLINLQIESLIETSIFIIFLVFIVILSFTNSLLFHAIVENYNCMISFGIFVIILNTYRFSKNNFLLFLGVGYIFVGLANILHIFSYPGFTLIFQKDNANLTVQFCVAAKYIETFTWLVSTILLYKTVKNFRDNFILMSYIGGFAMILLFVSYFKLLPTYFLQNHGFTKSKFASEYIMLWNFLLVAILYYKSRKKINGKMFFYIECFLFTKIVSEIFLISASNFQDYAYLTSHMLKSIACYFLYKGVIELGLKKPYHSVSQELNNVGDQLRDVNSKLIEEKEMRKNMEEMIVTNENCYDLIINNCSDAITVISDGKFVFANSMAIKLMGTESISDVIGKNMEDTIPPKMRPKVKKFTENLILSGGSSSKFETNFLNFNKKEIEVEIICCYVLYRGKPAYMNIFRDITSRKRIRKLENDLKQNEKVVNETKEMNRLITEFYVNISHELKTPLNVILAAIQILQMPSKEQLPDFFEIKLNKYLKTMKQNCFRLLRLINNIIDSSKLNSGYLKANMGNYNIVSVVEEITMSVADYIQDKGVDLIFDTDTEEKVMAIDADKIERVILNLLSNAVKFTDKGDQIMVAIDDSNDNIIISVRDTGVGIPEDKLNMIFERFGQVDKTLSRNQEGSGIGLTLVKSIINMHDGNIKVESKVGEGCNFIIELPVKIVKEEKISENFLYTNNVQRISIEFSDIYS